MSQSASARPASQFALMRQRRFAPFFWVQFSGAANDNVFKFALTVLLTYRWPQAWLPPELSGLVIAGLFIAPFVLLSATAGQLADKFDKRRIMGWVKWLEVAIMGAALWGLWHAQTVLLLLCILAMGVHSTLFGPVKFAYLPAHLRAEELTGGNGMVEMGTFVAILLGNVLGGVLVGWPEVGPLAVGVACLGLALLGRAAVHWVPATPSPMPTLRIRMHPWRETRDTLALARQDPLLWRTMLAISWMWFYGAVFLAQFPAFAKLVLHGDAQVALVLLVLFSVGLGLGALSCERLSRGRVEIGLTPYGALGMTVFALDLFFACKAVQPPTQGLWDVAGFLQQGAHWRVVVDLVALSLSAGIYSVPMHALFQWRGPASHVARLVAANNILNALYMVLSSLSVAGLLAAGLDMAEVFLTLAVANALHLAWLLWREPDYARRAWAWWRGR